MLEVRNISKSFGAFSLREVSFTVDKGDYFVLLGLSGAGKSLILELIAGLVQPDSGTILLNGRDITRHQIQQRSTGVVFQDLALFPHMTVAGNMLYPALARKINAERRKNLVKEIAESLGITHLLHRHPAGLSGGEQQRVALARVLMYHPDILLLDEPLASLDVQLRDDIRSLLRRINSDGRTIIHVTHDYDEAVSLANRVAVIQDGQVVQEGKPREVFGKPRSSFVARFAGIKNYYQPEPSPKTAGIKGIIRLSGDFAVEAGDTDPEKVLAVMIDSGGISICREKGAGSPLRMVPAWVSEVMPARGGTEVLLDAGLPVSVLLPDFSPLVPAAGEQVYLSWQPGAVTVIER